MSEATHCLQDLGRAKQVIIIGDSNSQIHDGRIYRDSGTGDLLAMNVRFIPGANAGSLLANENNIAPEVLQALNRSGLITDSGFVRYLSVDPDQVMNDMAWGRPQTPPPVLMMVGDLNVKHQLSEAMAEGFDLIIPNGFVKYPIPDNTVAGQKILPFKLFLETVDSIFDKVFCFAEILRGAGLKRLFLHSLPPPYASDSLFRAMYKHSVSKRVRYKVVLVVNALLERRCAEVGIGFVDVWGDVIEPNGEMAARFALDGGHLHPDACRFTIDRLLACVRRSQRDNTNTARYDVARNRTAPATVGSDEPAVAALRECAVSLVPLESLVQLNAEDIDFAAASASFEDLDWAFRPAEAEVGADWGRPGVDWLARLDGCLAEAPARRLLEAATGGQAIVFSARPFRLRGGAIDLDDWARGAWPIGIMRGLAVLAGKSGLVFQDQTTGARSGPFGGPGSLVVYDPRRVDCILPDDHGFLAVDLHIGPKVPEMRPRLIWNGRNCWPGDPFFFYLSKALVMPPQDRPFVALLAVPYQKDQPAVSWDRETYWVLEEG